MRIFIYLSVAILYCCQLSAQSSRFRIPDSLNAKSVDYITQQLESSEDDDFKDSIYAFTYLYKAKANKNPEDLINAYKTVMYKSDDNLRLKYCDSILQVATRSKDKGLIGSAYLTKGTVYNAMRKHTNALDNFILANNFISQTDDQYLLYKSKYSIALIKSNLGYYHEAISLLKECENYFKIEEPGLPYLNTLHALTLCYLKVNQIDLATRTIKTGWDGSAKENLEFVRPYYLNAEGQIDFHEKKYKDAIDKLIRSLPKIIERKDFATEAIASFYIGKSFWLLGKKDEAIPYFKKVDDIFVGQNFIKQDIVEAYDLLAQYYKADDNIKMEIKYLQRLHDANVYLFDNFRYLASTINKEYDLKKINDEIEQLNKDLSQGFERQIFLGLLFVIAAITIATFICRKYQKGKIQKQKFRTIILHKEMITAPADNEDAIIDKDLIIKAEIVKAVSVKLTEFEHSTDFLDKDFNLNKMAKYVNVNTRYASRIILATRKKKYIDYIDGLRINYILNKLKTESKYRNYKITALADEAGFKSPQKFRDAFFKCTDLDVVYFINEFSKNKNV